MASLPREASKLPEYGWGKYAEAVARWEGVVLREPPHPRVASPRGNLRLSPCFVEWMVGLPEGWVTRIPEASYRDQLTILGNGVVVQQAAAALRELLARAQPSSTASHVHLHDCALNRGPARGVAEGKQGCPTLRMTTLPLAEEHPRPAALLYGDVRKRG